MFYPKPKSSLGTRFRYKPGRYNGYMGLFFFNIYILLWCHNHVRNSKIESSKVYYILFIIWTGFDKNVRKNQIKARVIIKPMHSSSVHSESKIGTVITMSGTRNSAWPRPGFNVMIIMALCVNIEHTIIVLFLTL